MARLFQGEGPRIPGTKTPVDGMVCAKEAVEMLDAADGSLFLGTGGVLEDLAAKGSVADNAAFALRLSE